MPVSTTADELPGRVGSTVVPALRNSTTASSATTTPATPHAPAHQPRAGIDTDSGGNSLARSHIRPAARAKTTGGGIRVSSVTERDVPLNSRVPGAIATAGD